jgi:outer membrane protein assembly factor BamB
MKDYKRIIVCLTTIMMFVLITGFAHAQNDPWTMYQGGIGHTGYVEISVNPADFTLRWSKNIGGNLPLNPVTAADGKVFVTKLVRFNDTDALLVLNDATGDTIWSKNFGDVHCVNPPSYAYGNVYVQVGDHSPGTFLGAYNADTGALVFESAHAAQWERYLAPTIYDGTVYINGGYYGGMYAFDAYTGRQNWFLNLPQYDQWTPAVDEQYAYSYLGGPGALYVADRLTGELAFQINDLNYDWRGYDMDLAPMLVGSNVYAIQYGRLINFDVEERIISWEFNRGYSGQPSYADGVLYAIASGSLTAIDPETGDELWSWTAPDVDPLNSTIIVTDTHIFISSNSKTYAVDLATRSGVWSYAAGGHLALGDNALYIASKAADGILTCIAYQPYASPTAVAGEDRIEYENVTLDASLSFDPDGQIVSYDWTVTRQDGSSAPAAYSGAVVHLTGLAAGFYDIDLLVTDNEGFPGTDSAVLAIMGPAPYCEYTEDDVLNAYDDGYDEGKQDHVATFDKETGALHIPVVLMDQDEVTFEMQRTSRKSTKFKLEDGRNLLQ